MLLFEMLGSEVGGLRGQTAYPRSQSLKASGLKGWGSHLNVPAIPDCDVRGPTVVQLEVVHRVAALVGMHMACRAGQ